MKIKIPWGKPVFSDKEKKYLSDALDSTWIAGGRYIEKFEHDFSECCGSACGVTTCNGSAALHLALLALGIGRGDEVIVPGFTFVAPANMVMFVSANPVYADIDPLSWCINPESVEKSITPNTRAILPVHIYGNVCDMDSLKDIAKRHNLYIIEDTAQAVFSKYKGRYAGTFGNAGCFSFQAAKVITMVEGGIVLTDDTLLAEKMRVIRDYGTRKGKRYWHDVIGHNFRLTNMQAAIGCGQFENRDNIIAARNKNYRSYIKQLKGVDGITMQQFKEGVDSVVWGIAVKIEQTFFRGDRDWIVTSMLEAGIETRPGFYAFSTMPVYNAPSLPISEEVGASVILLPSFASLSDEEIIYICDTLKGLRK